MWCPVCHADVATELSADHQWLSCTQCRSELTQTAIKLRNITPGPHPLSDDAAELLARWSAENLLTPETHSAPPSQELDTVPAAATTAEIATSQEPDTIAVEQSASGIATTRKHRQKGQRPRRSASNWVATSSQLAAYLGVLLLTCGTAAVVSGHFGQTPRTAVTGWLLATVGQMLLFLGVISLIATGLEQMKSDMAKRFQRLERRLRQRELREQTSATESKSRVRASKTPLRKAG